MRGSLRRFLCAAILALCATGAAANAAQAAAALDHACCHRVPAESPAAPDSPCDGFLPLTCCRAAGLPTTEPGSPPTPAAVAFVGSVPIAAAPRVAMLPPASAGLSPSAAAIQRSVVLLI